MSTRDLDQQGPSPVVVGREREVAPGVPGPDSASRVVLSLQRSAGNAAVVAYLSQQGRRASRAPGVGLESLPPRLRVQRCGPVPCDCPPHGHAGDSLGVEEATDPLAEAGAGSQGAGLGVQRACDECEEDARREVTSPRSGPIILQRWPGDGMTPPGDCDWSTYLPLALSTESAKAVVSMMGACSPGDSCQFLALKIAAITAEIAARVAVATTCFKGGDTGHRQQIDDKVNMLNRCWRFFQGKNCPQNLITAMEVVVAAARSVIEIAATAAAAAVVIAAVVALVAAIAALIDVIAAAAAAVAAAAAEVAAIAAALAAMAALVVTLRGALSSGTGSPGGA